MKMDIHNLPIGKNCFGRWLRIAGMVVSIGAFFLLFSGVGTAGPPVPLPPHPPGLPHPPLPPGPPPVLVPPHPPGPPVVIAPGHPPYPGAVWVPGYHRGHRWVPGHWSRGLNMAIDPDMIIDTDMTVVLDVTRTEGGDKRLKLHRGE